MVEGLLPWVGVLAALLAIFGQLNDPNTVPGMQVQPQRDIGHSIMEERKAT